MLDLTTLKNLEQAFSFSSVTSFISTFLFVTDSFTKKMIQRLESVCAQAAIPKTPMYPMFLKTGPLKKLPSAAPPKSVPSTTASRNVLLNKE